MNMNWYDYDNASFGCMGCLLFLVICICLGALSGFIFMLLWNWLIPLFWTTAPHLTFWQSWGCMVLLGIISNFFRSSKNS